MAILKYQGNLSFLSGWNIRALAMSVVISVALAVGYFYVPSFRSLLYEWDVATFYAMNGSVESGGIWAKFAAYSNSKIYDVLSGVFLVFVLAAFILAGWGRNWNKRLAAVLFMGLYVTITTVVRRKLGIMEYGYHSPSEMGLIPFYDLSEMFPDYKPKVSSLNSFPSDHGIFCILYATFFWYFAGWRWGVFVCALMPFFMLPRLVGGAHWLSDTTIGGVSCALMIIAFALYTPLAAVCCRGLERAINALTARLSGLLPKTRDVRGI